MFRCSSTINQEWLDISRFNNKIKDKTLPLLIDVGFIHFLPHPSSPRFRGPEEKNKFYRFIVTITSRDLIQSWILLLIVHLFIIILINFSTHLQFTTDGSIYSYLIFISKKNKPTYRMYTLHCIALQSFLYIGPILVLRKVHLK